MPRDGGSSIVMAPFNVEAHRPQLRRVALVYRYLLDISWPPFILHVGVLVSGNQRDLCTRLSGVRCGSPGRTRADGTAGSAIFFRRTFFSVQTLRHDRLRPHLADRHSRRSDSRDRIAGRSRHLCVDHRDCFRTVLQAAARDPLQRLRSGRTITGTLPHSCSGWPNTRNKRSRSTPRRDVSISLPDDAAAGPSTRRALRR